MTAKQLETRCIFNRQGKSTLLSSKPLSCAIRFLWISWVKPLTDTLPSDSRLAHDLPWTAWWDSGCCSDYVSPAITESRSKTNYFCFSQAMFTHLSPHRSFRGICEICHRRVWFYNGISPINFFDIKCIERNFELRVGSFVPSRLEKKNYYQKQNRSSKLFILWRNL